MFADAQGFFSDNLYYSPPRRLAPLYTERCYFSFFVVVVLSLQVLIVVFLIGVTMMEAAPTPQNKRAKVNWNFCTAIGIILLYRRWRINSNFLLFPFLFLFRMGDGG